MQLPPDHPRMIPRQGSDPAADRQARLASTPLLELEKEAADVRRTWPSCPHLAALEAAIGAAHARARAHT